LSRESTAMLVIGRWSYFNELITNQQYLCVVIALQLHSEFDKGSKSEEDLSTKWTITRNSSLSRSLRPH